MHHHRICTPLAGDGNVSQLTWASVICMRVGSKYVSGKYCLVGYRVKSGLYSLVREISPYYWDGQLYLYRVMRGVKTPHEDQLSAYRTNKTTSKATPVHGLSFLRYITNINKRRQNPKKYLQEPQCLLPRGRLAPGILPFLNGGLISSATP